jgi:hypothetical protein
MFRITTILLLAVTLAPPVAAQDKSVLVPYRLTRTQHILVRTKINGKGPFHFIMDTGCPVLVISEEAAKKAGLASEKGKAKIDRLEFEGGLVQEKVPARVETPFQIEGMNNMGLPGIELHGLMGYTVLAKYRIEVDLTSDRMRWTPLAFDPPPPENVRNKVDVSGIEMMGGLMKVISKMAGLKPAPPAVPRGFVGVEIETGKDAVTVKAVLPESPAQKAGLRAGDVIEKINSRKIATTADIAAALSDLQVDRELTIGVRRGDESVSVKLKSGQGF